MDIHLGDRFSYSRLLRFTLPPIIMMIFTSIYGVVDGFFVSNYAGKTAFAAVNLIMPFLMLFGALGFMVGTGGSALVSKTLGEGQRERAQGLFSMLIWLSVAASVVLAVLGVAFMRPIAALLGAQGQMLDDCVVYGRILTVALPAFVLQNEFQSFLIAAERPKLGLAVTVGAGVTNMVLDALFVGVFRWGIAGAAWATVLSQVVGGAAPLVWFLCPNTSCLRLVKPLWDGGALVRTLTNGSSEMMTNLSLSLSNMLYNFQLMRLVGEDGVSAYGAIMYVNFVFISVFIGYSIGSSPIVSFHYGAGNTDELKSLFRKSIVLMTVGAVLMTVLAELLAAPMAGMFVGYDARLLAMTRRAFMIYFLALLPTGLNIFGSGFFTALNDGLVSAVLSFLRIMVLQIVAVLLLPLVLGLDGVWLSILVAEGLALAVTMFCFVIFRKKYQY